ncbi:MAG TPA: MoaD/ThiS family protein [Chitinophagaceae bacterium]|nr:MoaD/ThiS family protein [Chitinophagaceae bacterium]
MQIILFGQLQDITGSHKMQLYGINNTDELTMELNKGYPLLANAKYLIAVEKEVVLKNTMLSDSSTVALLPPFAGG